MAVAKKVLLVRHAQSEANLATSRLAGGDPMALLNLTQIGYDAPVSAAGRLQLEHARAQLEGLVAERSIELVAHSPLLRAVDTCQAVFGERGAPIVELPFMYERTPSEWVWQSMMDQRIAALAEWLNSRQEHVIALVGHGQYFKRCLGLQRVQHNIEILEVSYNSTTGFGAYRSVFAGFPDPKPEDVEAQGNTNAPSDGPTIFQNESPS
mmetsp:Transcript_83640/g.166994  ORF Transcript_83640/g.166994 Transcript_83640/m.166994 type:complete len:209 (-) Transcript_83640:331-957(-)|eukprot:CAMPEP_0174698640 /NCGR_PEP_ID=MMETSP1094-20130205/4176_1 /TAXON_ID=156173 /ORGANISM="Chrysochromulina brevifilum, Strain UTEX LB 985" /LENGTH=208 /DNA_ID=CAMNT_0015895847 /DNA_START=113 /DNA_END=739 /DNA_ORIENTATION=+